MSKTYRSSQVNISFGGVAITGYDDGTFLSIVYNNDFFTLQKGADGESLRSSSEDLSARVELTLLQGSEANDELSALFNADVIGDVGGLPFISKDNSGTTLHSATSMWIVKSPDVTRAKEGQPVTWVLETGRLLGNVGGH